MGLTRRWVMTLTCMLVALSSTPADGRTMGLGQELYGACVGVRLYAFHQTIITGVRFPFNDILTIPEVILAADSQDGGRPGNRLRSTHDVTATSEGVATSFDPFMVPVDQFIWIVVRLPDLRPYRHPGSGGGPGFEIRCPAGSFPGTTSHFWTADGFGSLGPEGNFDIDIVTSSAPAKAVSTSNPAQPQPLALSIRANASLDVTTFGLYVPHAGSITLNVYSISGRRVASLGTTLQAACHHDLVWRRQASDGRVVASGVYFFEIQAGTTRRSGKVVIVR